MTRIRCPSLSKTQRASTCALFIAVSAAWPAVSSAQSATNAPQPSLAPPPPAIVLEAAPAPELAPREWDRRPVELAPEFALGLPNCADGTANDQRCAGLSAGAGFGLTGLWRVSPYFAWGGGLCALGFGFSPPRNSGLTGAKAGGAFVGVLGRVYFLERGALEPYLELGLGVGAARTTASEAGSPKITETTAGGAVRIGAGFEFYATEHLRLGPALSWTRFHAGQVARCAGQQCVDLSADENGHGVGFTTVSLRLSILLGAAL